MRNNILNKSKETYQQKSQEWCNERATPGEESGEVPLRRCLDDLGVMEVYLVRLERKCLRQRDKSPEAGTDLMDPRQE